MEDKKAFLKTLKDKIYFLTLLNIMCHYFLYQRYSSKTQSLRRNVNQDDTLSPRWTLCFRVILWDRIALMWSVSIFVIVFWSITALGINNCREGFSKPVLHNGFFWGVNIYGFVRLYPSVKKISKWTALFIKWHLVTRTVKEKNKDYRIFVWPPMTP